MKKFKNIESILKKIIVNYDHIDRQIIKSFDFENEKPAQVISKEYFYNHGTIEERLNLGVIETPEPISSYMVDLVFKQWISNNKDTDPSKIHWFDPCGGAGVFPLKIYEYYIQRLHIKNEDGLPSITISEISGIGALSIAKSIYLYLETNGFDVSRLISMNKLKVLNVDTLMHFSYFDDLINNHKFDIVIGNPPYIRSSRLALEYKDKLKRIYKNNYSSGFDLYYCFILMGVISLNENGCLAYISPTSFTRAKNAERLRGWLYKNAQVSSYIDLDESKVFCNADVHAAIYVLSKSNKVNNTCDFLHVKNNDELAGMLNKSLNLNNAFINRSGTDGWSFHESMSSLKNTFAIYKNTIPMSELNVHVYSGIRTGFSSAYIFPDNGEFIFSQEVDEKLLRPIILPANIKKWAGNKRMHKILFIPHKAQINDEAVLEYLEKYKDRLSSRTEAKNNYWYALRACNYYDEMLKRKIAFPDLSSTQRFSIVEKGTLIPDGAYFLNTDNLVILGILNSSLAREYFVNNCSSVGNLNTKGRFRFKKEFVKKFPLPKNVFENGPIQNEIKILVEKLISIGDNEELSCEIDGLIAKLYREEDD